MNTISWIVASAYLAFAAITLFWTWRLRISIYRKSATIATVLTLFAVLPVAWVKNVSDDKRAEIARSELQHVARAYFQKMCDEKSGERINQVVDGVEGIFLQRPREKPTDSNLRDQYWMGDPYGFVMYPPVEIARYLQFLDKDNIPTRKRTARAGYEYVVVPRGEGYVSYRLAADKERLVPEVLDRQPSRYAVLWEDISTREDRSHWVAGSRLTVREISRGRVLGERTAYVFDSALGSTQGARKPWLIARYKDACPPKKRGVATDRLFVEKVLRPKEVSEHGK